MQIRTIHTQFDYHRISFSVSLLLQGYLSLPLTHTHYNSLLDSSILITVLSSESIMSACVVKFRAHPAASFSLLVSNPSYSFACTKAKAKFISIHSLFRFLFLFYYSLTLSLLLLILGDHNATRKTALVDVPPRGLTHARF